MSDTIITPFQTCGPLFGFALLPEGVNQSAEQGAADSITLEGVICDGEGEHIGHGAFVEFWSQGQATRSRTLDGRYRVTMKRPVADPAMPTGQPAPCLNVLIFTRGLARPLMTRIYLPDQVAENQADPVLGMVDPAHRDRLVASPGDRAGHFRHDIYLQGPKESVFFAVQAP